MTGRPKYKPHPDLNHSIVPDAVMILGNSLSLPVVPLDMSKVGGKMVDWLVWIGPLCIAFEVKAENARTDFTPGEIYFLSRCPGPVAVVSTTQEVIDIITSLVSIPLAWRACWMIYGIPDNHEITKERMKQWLHKS